MNKKKPKFYEQGIRFGCTGDGKCCVTRGRNAYVYLSFGDRKRLSAHFNLTMAEFLRAYTEKEDGLTFLRSSGDDCCFLVKGKCIVYAARPWQCRTWPFWPENMHPRVWETEVAAFCPGVGKGRLYSASEIEDILKRRADVADIACRPEGKP